MSKILVSGLINLETTLQIERFPQEYFPVRYPFFGVKSTISGVGFNIARAMTILGDQINLLSIIGNDFVGQVVFAALQADHLPPRYILRSLSQTPQSVILYDTEGKRQIHVDLKDIQDQAYPRELYEEAIEDCALAVLCNIDFSRPFLVMTRKKGVWVAADVHAIESLDDAYNQDFMEAANILFMSHERLPCSPQDWVKRMQNRFGAEIIVIGLGSQGVLLAVRSDHFLEHLPAVNVRPVVNTIGAGDALFSCFLHYYVRDRDPYQAIRKAIFFASHKVGVSGAAEGFLNEIDLERLFNDYTKHLVNHS